MKKYLLGVAISVALPVLGFAAYNDVTLTTAAKLTVGGYSLTISGTSAVVQSTTVNASNFSVVLLPNSVIAISSASGQVLSNDAASTYITGNQCVGGVSTLTLSSSSGAAVTVTVTPSTSICSGSATSASGGGTGNGAPGSSGGGGGGGGGGSSLNVVTPAAPATPATPATPAVPGVSSAVPAAPAIPAIPAVVFKKILSIGVSSPDVQKLQQILNADPDTKVAVSGVGSPGKETKLFGPATKKAIQKFQLKYKIAKPGESGYGVLGPKTRAKLNEISSQGSVSAPAAPAVSPAPAPAPAQSSNNTSDIAKQLSDSLKLLQALQAQLKALK